MTDHLLDSSFLIGYFNELADRKTGPARKFRSLMPARARLYVSIASMAELLDGAEDPDEAERQLLEIAIPLGLHRQHARRTAIMQKRARARGARMGEKDAWIAATAALGHLKIVGDDDEAFADRVGVVYANFRANAEEN